MKQKSNKGFTLIEILVSLAIMSVVGTAVVGFMNVSAKTYTGVNNEVSVQYEAQLTVNQIKDLIIDANKGVSYCLQSVDGTYKAIDPKNPNSETEILNDFYAANANNVDKVKRCLLIYNEKAISATAYQYPVMKIVWNPATEEITYTDKTFAAVTDLTADEYLQSIPESNYKLLAEYVTEFSVGLLNINKNQVDFVASFRDGNKTFKTTPTIALRNKVVVSDDLRQIYNPLPPQVPNLALRVRIKKNGIYITKDTLMAGTVAEYEAVVDMLAGATPDNSVTWFLEGSVVDEGKIPSTVDQMGKVTVSKDEKSTILTLKAVSPLLPNKPAIVTIEVKLIDFSKGYVRSVSLGEKLTTNITGTADTGIYSESYRFDFEDRAPFIVYINEEKVKANERGITWSLETQAPRGSYTWNASNGEITAYAGANGYNFEVTARAKITTTDKTTYASDTRNIFVNNIKEPKEPDVNIDPETIKLSRNENTTLKAKADGVVDPIYKWEIVGYSDEFEENTHWFEYLKKSNVKLINANSETATININEILAWKKSFWVDVRLTVTGKALDKTGNLVDFKKSTTTRLYIDKVDVHFELPEGNVIRYNDAARKVIPVFDNLVGYKGDIEMTIYQYPVNENRIPIQGNTMSGEFFSYNQKTLQLSLDKNGKTALSRNIKKNDRFSKIEVYFTFSNRYEGPQMKAEPEAFILEYQE